MFFLLIAAIDIVVVFAHSRIDQPSIHAFLVAIRIFLVSPQNCQKLI
jgi:hypothetical protein